MKTSRAGKFYRMFYHKCIVRAVDCMAHSDRIRDTEFTTFTAAFRGIVPRRSGAVPYS